MHVGNNSKQRQWRDHLVLQGSGLGHYAQTSAGRGRFGTQRDHRENARARHGVCAEGIEDVMHGQEGAEPGRVQGLGQTSQGVRARQKQQGTGSYKLKRMPMTP